MNSARQLLSLSLGICFFLCSALALPIAALGQDDSDAEGDGAAEATESEAVGEGAATDDPASSEEAGDGESDPEAEPGPDGAPAAAEAVPTALRTKQRLREIGNQVDALKEDTFATKSRLLLLREGVLRRSVAGSKVVVIHRNDYGSEYKLVQAAYYLDRESKARPTDYDDGVYGNAEETLVFDEKLVPGTHVLTVVFVFKGNPWGVFTYNEGYTFQVTQEFPFTAEEGVAHEIVVTALEDDDFFKPLEERPTIRFQPSTHQLDDSNADKDQ